MNEKINADFSQQTFDFDQSREQELKKILRDCHNINVTFMLH